MRMKFVIVLLLCALPASAQMLMLHYGMGSGSGSTYVGPGDVNPSATAWFGLRGYSRAAAVAGTTKAVNIRRAADNHTCDLLIISSGALGSTANCSSGADNGQSALAFAGTHGTCTGTTSGTTLTCTGATVTPAVLDMISAVGTYGLYIASCGTFTGGAGTCTLGAPASPDISTPETFTFINSLRLTTFYDQSGSGINVAQVTANSQPAFNPIGYNATQPVISTGTTTALQTGSCGSCRILYATGVAARQISLTTQQDIFSQFDSVNNTSGQTMYWTSANTMNISSGTAVGVVSATASDLVVHSFQGVFNGASSVLRVDDTETAGTISADGGAVNFFCVAEQGGTCADVNQIQGLYTEVGLWPAIANGTVRTSMCNNMRLYWGTPGSC